MASNLRKETSPAWIQLKERHRLVHLSNRAAQLRTKIDRRLMDILGWLDELSQNETATLEDAYLRAGIVDLMHFMEAERIQVYLKNRPKIQPVQG